MRQWTYAGLALLALGACAGTPHEYDDVMTPAPHDFRVEAAPIEPEAPPVPKPTGPGQFVSANGELCAPSANDLDVVVCGIGGKAVVVNDILSDSF